MNTRTKIICTIGPRVNTQAKMEELIHAGMNVARLNFSHGTHETHGHMIRFLKAAREKLGVPLAIMLDTKGPEIRLGHLKEESVVLQKGDRLWLQKEQIEGDKEHISIMPPSVLDALEMGASILFDDGYVITHVVALEKDRVQVEVDHGGVIKPLKGVNIPGCKIELPAVTDKDREDIIFGCAQDVDFIAASFVRSADQVIAIKQILVDEGKPEIGIIAKIENRTGVENFDSIVQVADGIMIARGDLGVELPLTEVPRLQKMMIQKCYLAGKPSITATQMLESMITNARPTRAEASDVANAIYDSTSAVMLSGETAVGQYAIKVVEVMKAIVEETERDFKYYEFFQRSTLQNFHDVASSVTHASIKTAYSSNARAIFTFTTSGFTARLLSRYRPEPPIIAMTSKPKVYNQLALAWGVVPLLSDQVQSIEEAYKIISDYALSKKIVRYGDLVIITAGTPFGRAGTTNMMIVDSIGDVLVRGTEGNGERVHGRILLVPSWEIEEYKLRGKIIVVHTLTEDNIPLLKGVAGVILENHSDDVGSENVLKGAAQRLKIPYVMRADGASTVLRQELLITLDPKTAVIYKGILPD